MMKNKLKKIIFFLPALLFFCFVEHADAIGNVYGWAWSENIGWISFNRDSYSDVSGGGGSYDYGVNIESNWTLSGYAWSENIGWITFNRADSGTPPASPYNGSETYIAKVDSATKKVYGWARACSVFASGCSGTLNANRGNWDGWINLSPTGNEVWIDMSISPAPFHYWGWGGSTNSSDSNRDAVIGWTSFNCAEGGVCGSYNYKVITTFSTVTNPAINSLTRDENYCYWGYGRMDFGWNFVKGTYNQGYSDFQISTNSGFTSLVVDLHPTSNGQTVFVGGVQTPRIDFNPDNDTTYYWRARVCDNQSPANCSGWTSGVSFSTSKHSWPHSIFTPTSTSPIVRTLVGFDDTGSTCYGASCTKTWDFDGGVGTNCTSTGLSCRYDSTGRRNISLSMCDPELSSQPNCSDGEGVCSYNKNIYVKNPSSTPIWKEISPF